MDSDFLEIIDEIMQSYYDKAMVEEVVGFWGEVGEGVDGGCGEAFLLGSVYGQCLFLFNSYFDRRMRVEELDEFRELVYSRISELKQGII